MFEDALTCTGRWPVSLAATRIKGEERHIDSISSDHLARASQRQTALAMRTTLSGVSRGEVDSESRYNVKSDCRARSCSGLVRKTARRLREGNSPRTLVNNGRLLGAFPPHALNKFFN
jgi:hypothetical protein